MNRAPLPYVSKTRNFAASSGFQSASMPNSVCRCLVILLLIVAIAAAQQNRRKASATQVPPSASSLTQEEIRELIRKSADNDVENQKKLRDYTYVERQELRKLDGKGQVKSIEVKTYDEINIYGEQVEKLVAKDDKPLSDKDQRKEDEKIQKLIDKRKNESDSDRQKRLAKEQKEREDDREFVREVADAFNFKFVAMETLDGRENYVIDGDPKPGYHPVHKEAKILPKTRFRVWIDKSDVQMKKLDVQFIDTVSFGWIVARIHKGSRAVIENTRVNDEVWLQRRVEVKADARVALLKDFNLAVDINDRDYKKFRTDTKIVPVGQMQEKP